MAKGIDLNKLGEEINRRKQSSGKKSQYSSEVPKKKFLNDLITTLETGQHTESVDRLNLIEEKVAEKLNEPKRARKSLPQQSIAEATTPISQKQNTVSENERDDKLYEEFKRKQAELKNKFQNGSNQNPYDVPNYYEQQPQQGQQGQFVNEDRVVTNVKKIVDGYLSENFSHVVEQTIKDSIIEMYAYERIKDVLTENKDLIKSVVIETIREIQARKKKS